MLRRAARHQELNAAPQDDIKVGRLCIAERRATVTFDGEVLHLTPTEYRILVVLAKRAGQVLSRSAIAREVWAYEDIGTSHLVDVHVGRLRLKLRRYQGSASLIVTVRGSGYRLGA